MRKRAGKLASALVAAWLCLALAAGPAPSGAVGIAWAQAPSGAGSGEAAGTGGHMLAAAVADAGETAAEGAEPGSGPDASAGDAAAAGADAAPAAEPLRKAHRIAAGMYTIKSSAGGYRLAVAGSSWNAGADARLAKPSRALGQTFHIRRASGSYYRITMALSGTALECKARRGKAAGNARMGRAGGKAAQLWKAYASDAGLVFANKATGGVLSVSGKARRGANVRVAAASGDIAPTQAWVLKRTAVKKRVKAFSNVRELVNRASAGGNRTVKVDARGTGYKMSKARRQQLAGALGEAWRRGEDVSFVMVDLDTGITVSCGADRANHGASTFKAAYCTYLFQSVFERRGGVDAGARSLLEQTMGFSSNDAYLVLRSRYGTGGFRAWLDTVGLAHLANEPFPRLTARNLARAWAKIYSYEHSGGRLVAQWRRLANHSRYSFIREQLGGSSTVYSKSGWYPRVMGYAALNDAGIVKRRNGRSYLLAVLSNTNCYSEQWIMRNVAKALDAVHREIPR